jgi:hypothetical protein
MAVQPGVDEARDPCDLAVAQGEDVDRAEPEGPVDALVAREAGLSSSRDGTVAS